MPRTAPTLGAQARPETPHGATMQTQSVPSVSGRGAGRDPQEARGSSQDSSILLANSAKLFRAPVGATDISRWRSPSVATGTDQNGFFASRQGRRNRILGSNNPGPAPFQGAWRCCEVSGAYARA